MRYHLLSVRVECLSLVLIAFCSLNCCLGLGISFVLQFDKGAIFSKPLMLHRVLLNSRSMREHLEMGIVGRDI